MPSGISFFVFIILFAGAVHKPPVAYHQDCCPQQPVCTGEHSSLCLAAIHESGHLHTVGICDAGHGKPQRANTVRPYACHSEGASRGIFAL